MPDQLAEQSAKTIAKFLVILNEQDSQTQEEIEKAKKGMKH
jgi:hypothetical protein